MLVQTKERRTAWIEHISGRSDSKADEREWTKALACPSSVQSAHVSVEAGKTVYTGREMSVSTGIRLLIDYVRYVIVQLTHGGTLCWNAICL